LKNQKRETRNEERETFLSHLWKVTPNEAVRIQEELRKKLILRPPRKEFRTIAAADVSYSRTDDRLYAAFLLFSYPAMTLRETASARGKVSFPYIPGLLTFREAPILLQAFSRLNTDPDLILFDGQGTAHPRSMGIAAHMGILVNRPSIGCAKSRLFGAEAEPGLPRGSLAPLAEGDRTVGMIVRTRSGVKPVYVSPGHKMDLDASVKIVLSLCRGYRIPEPLRQAHIFVNLLRGKG
jgi:deoxyribonuclease V